MFKKKIIPVMLSLLIVSATIAVPVSAGSDSVSEPAGVFGTLNGYIHGEMNGSLGGRTNVDTMKSNGALVLDVQVVDYLTGQTIRYHGPGKVFDLPSISIDPFTRAPSVKSTIYGSHQAMVGSTSYGAYTTLVGV